MRDYGRIFVVCCIAILASAHVGSPDVFYSGRAGPYEVRVMVRPPEVVPGIAYVTVHVPVDARAVLMRPVYWRAGSRGAPAPDAMRRAPGQSNAFEGSLWLMAHGANSVDVFVDGARGRGHVLVPVAAIATGRLPMNGALAALLAALGLFLVSGLVNIVYKAAGESLVEMGHQLEPARASRARRVAAIALPVLALALFGGARWWRSVDVGYERSLYHAAPLALALNGDVLRLQASDTLWQPSGRDWRASALVPDHGKLMHLFLVRVDDARAFAHLHPQAIDSSANPRFDVTMPALPSGRYHVFADVVHETGQERTLVGMVTLDSVALVKGRTASAHSDVDDAWFVGDATREATTKLADGATMSLQLIPDNALEPEREESIRVTVREANGAPARLEPYLGMAAHAVVIRTDGSVFIHLHPMGTVTMAAQQAFETRDRGDTTADGRLKLPPGGGGSSAMLSPQSAQPTSGSFEFPYAFPRSGSYRLFVQVRHNGRVQTGAFALTVAKPARVNP